MANRRLVSVDSGYLFPTPLEARLAAKMAASVTDSAVAAQVNATSTGAAIDARINTQVTPVVQQITADYIAGDAAVVDAAAAAVDANPKILSLETLALASKIRVSSPASVAEVRVAVGVRVPFRLPFDSSNFRIHFRNRNPQTGISKTGAVTFTATAVATAQISGGAPIANSTTAGSSIQGSATLAAGGEYVTPYKTDYPLTAGTWYHLSYGITTAGTEFYAGAGQAWMNTAPTSVLNQNMAGAAVGYQVPLDVWIEAVPIGGGTPEVVFAGIAAPLGDTGAETSSRTALAAFGDSLTDGGANGSLWPETDTWVYKLQTLLAGTSITNLGYTGAVIDEMLMRAGVMPVVVNVPTGGVAAAANAAVTPAQFYALPSVSRTIDLTYNGANCRIIKDAAGVWTLYNYGSSTIPAGRVTLSPVTGWAGHQGDTAIIWVGINDNTYGLTGLESTVADHIVAGHQKLIQWLSPRVKQVMILGIHARTSETTGTAGNTTVLEVNRRLKELYPGYFKSIHDYLRGPAITDLGLTATTDDTTAIANGTVPPSVLAVGDPTHISKETAAILPSKFFAPFIQGKGYTN